MEPARHRKRSIDEARRERPQPRRRRHRPRESDSTARGRLSGIEGRSFCNHELVPEPHRAALPIAFAAARSGSRQRPLTPGPLSFTRTLTRHLVSKLVAVTLGRNGSLLGLPSWHTYRPLPAWRSFSVVYQSPSPYWLAMQVPPWQAVQKSKTRAWREIASGSLVGRGSVSRREWTKVNQTSEPGSGTGRDETCFDRGVAHPLVIRSCRSDANFSCRAKRSFSA